jgi:hypothetical protein
MHNAQSVVLRADHPNCLNHMLFHMSNEAYLVWHKLPYAVLSPEEDGASGATDGAAPIGEDAELAGLYSTASSAEALADNNRRKEAAIARLKAAVQAGPDVAAAASKASSASKPVSTAWEVTHKEELWRFFSHRPALERNFASAMSELDRSANRALVADYTWHTLAVVGLSSAAESTIGAVRTGVVKRSESVDLVVDIGGAEGSFLAAVLSGSPSIPNGMLFDLQGNIERAQALWKRDDTKARFGALASSRNVELVSGDFFRADTIPTPLSRTSATIYVLRQILHDWDDRSAARILHNLRQRLRGFANVALVIIEVNKHVPEHSPSRSFIDGQMLVCCNARERTPAQWDVLFRSTGWQLTQRVQTRSMFSVMELQPAVDETGDAAAATSTPVQQTTPAKPAAKAQPTTQQQQDAKKAQRKEKDEL